MILNFIRKRLPEQSEVYTVLGVVVFVVYGWSMRGFFYEVPSFILYFKVGQIFAIFSYMMGFALLESLLVTLCLGLLSLLLPVSWFKNGFVYKSFITVLVGAIALLWLENTIMAFNNKLPPVDLLLSAAGIVLGVWVVLLLAFHYIKLFQNPVLFIADRVGVMAYLYIPLGILGLIVVLIRNI
jgi:hypothetical protein